MRPTGSRALVGLVAAVAIALAVPRPATGAEPEWNIARIGAPAPAPSVLVAVVDTGVDAAHPALAGRVERAIDLVGGPEGDPNGHGTHVAGTVAGADAGCGAIGVVPDARILPVRVLDRNGEGTASVVAEGIRRAADAGAVVINLSLGTDVVLRNVSGSGLREAVEYAWSKGSIPVLAAGNDGLVGGVFGSGYGGLPAVVVTATDHRDRVAPYATSIGSAEWGVAAPGGDSSGEPGRDILSAFPDRRCALNAGTSMAAPHASGALAALRAAGYDRSAAVQRLLATARDLGSPGPDGTYGHGLVDLRAALETPPPPPPPSSPATSAPPASDPQPSSSPPAPPPTTTTTRRPSPETSAADPVDAPAPGGDSVDEVPEGAPDEGPDDGEEASPEIAPTDEPVPLEDVEGSAAPPGEADDEEEGMPGALVVAAVAALGVAGAASGVAVRRLGRRA